MTLPGFQPITPIVDVTYQGLLISGTEQGIEIGQAIEVAFVDGNVTYGAPEMTTLPNGEPGWRIKVTIANVDHFAYQGDWIVLDSQNNLSIWHGTSAWAGVNPEFAGKFTTNTPIIWAATTTAPVVTAEAGGEAKITFPQPVSANSPFTYTVTQTDTTTGTTGAATLSGQPIVSGGEVTLTVTGLTAGDEVAFEVTVDTPYEGVTVTSLPTAPITAVA